MSYREMEHYVREETSYTTKDRYDLPASEMTFEGGSNCRIEISGIESPSNLEEMVKEAERRDITIHRVISLVRGATLLDDQELKEFAQIGADNKLELLVNPVPSRGWDNGRQYTTDEGFVSGMRLRGHDALGYYLKEIDRCLDAGLRGFLITDEGMLVLLNGMREKGIIPEDTTFKVSVFAGHGTAAGGKLVQELGANSFNPLGDLTLPMLASIRQGGVNIPLDVYMSLVESMGNFQRFHEAGEIARVASPVYYKIEPGYSEAEMYNVWIDSKNPNYLDNLARERVKLAQIILEWLDRSEYDIVCNDYKGDLSIPKP